MEPIFKELLHQIEENIWEIVVMTTGLIEVEGILIKEEDHLMKGDIPTEIEDLKEEEDQKMMEDPPMDMEDPPGPVRPVIVQQPQVILDTTSLENMFDTMGQSMLQLARVQDQTNHHLQHIQQGQLNMQTHAGVLQQLANSTHQWNFDHIFASISIYDGSNREEFFPWLDHLEAACYYCGRDIKTVALGRSAGPLQNVIMALPHTKSWSAIREELKWIFSE